MYSQNNYQRDKTKNKNPRGCKTRYFSFANTAGVPRYFKIFQFGSECQYLGVPERVIFDLGSAPKYKDGQVIFFSITRRTRIYD